MLAALCGWATAVPELARGPEHDHGAAARMPLIRRRVGRTRRRLPPIRTRSPRGRSRPCSHSLTHSAELRADTIPRCG